jgi:hypothetical protein
MFPASAPFLTVEQGCALNQQSIQVMRALFRIDDNNK